MLTIFLSTIKDRKISLAIYCLAGVALLWVYVMLFPSVQAQAEVFSELMKNYPEGLLRAFGIEDGFTLSTLESFLAVRHFNFIWPILVIFLLVPLAAGGIAGEVERGTSEIMLARPVSRKNIFLGRYLAGVFTLIVFAVFSIFSVVPLAEFHGIDYAMSGQVLYRAGHFLVKTWPAAMGVEFIFGFIKRSVALPAKIRPRFGKIVVLS